MMRKQYRMNVILGACSGVVIAVVGLLSISQLPQAVGQQAAIPASQPISMESFPVTITVDASAIKGELKPIYRFFGADEPNYAYMKDGLKLLGDIGQLGAPQEFFRAHNMLTTGDGTPAFKWGSTNIYTEDAQGNPIYDFTIVDRIFDAYLKNGVKPYAQLGFMPKAMSTTPEPYQHSFVPGGPTSSIYTGWAYPPKSYDKWRELCYQWVKHCVDKYGKEEVEKWYWEVWNEPNIGYWKGTKEEFYKLHDYAIDGVKKALPTARVGGSDCAGSGQSGNWQHDFIEHCLRGKNEATGQIGSPLDFLSFHAKGSPTFVNGHVRTGISNQLRAINEGFGIVASFPETKNKPIVIGESDPDGCAACTGPQLGYRNTTMYSSYSAASFGRELDIADRHGVNLEGALTWAFEFENQPIFAGFREMATTGGVNLPVFNVFRMLAKMSGKRVAVESTGGIALDDIMRGGVRGDKADVSAMAAVDGHKLFVFAWHYHDDDVAGPDAAVSLALKGLPSMPPTFKAEHYRIDKTHSNAHTAWEKMGSPKEPTPQQYAELTKAGQLESAEPPTIVNAANGITNLKLNLPRQGVSLIVISW